MEYGGLLGSNAYRLVVVGESTLEEARSIPYFATDIVGFARSWV